MSATEQIYEGSCLCGRARFRATGPLGPMTHCHCTDCRKSHGAAFATYVEVPRERFAYVAGSDQLQTYTAESGTRRAFCRHCGSILISEAETDLQFVYIAAATLDTPVLQRPESHIFVRSKVPWLEIRDGLPQHAAYPEDQA
ncbi:MAG: GFA family protein [Acidobacteriota bacterium]